MNFEEQDRRDAERISKPDGLVIIARQHARTVANIETPNTDFEAILQMAAEAAFAAEMIVMQTLRDLRCMDESETRKAIAERVEKLRASASATFHVRDRRPDRRSRLSDPRNQEGGR